MKNLIRSFLLAVSFFSSVTFAQGLSVQNLSDNIVNAMINQQRTPGVAVAIFYQGKEYLFNYGVANLQSSTPISSDTIFELASITKIFTTSALSVLVQQGKVKLTDPISSYLPTLANTQGLAIDQVRIIDLATHTASFPRDIAGFGADKNDQAGFMQSLKSWQPTNPIGSNYLYSNVGFGLLGKVIANASGQDYQTLLTTIVTSPLGMNNTFVTVPASSGRNQAQGYNPMGNPAPAYQPGFLYGGGAVRSSARDLLAFMEANLGVKANVPPLLQTALLKAQQPYYQVKPGFSMALGWQRMTKSGTLLLTKNGMNQGFSSFIGFAPTQKIGVVVLANKRDAQATRIGNQLLQGLLGN